MKFIKLELQNLASLDRKDGEVINFTEGALGQSTIFSIVGPTGSGKSTILDAICLALYNRAPRYPRKKGEKASNITVFGGEDEEGNGISALDGRNILTRGQKSGYSKLTFLANNSKIYRAEWHVKFNRKKFDNPTLLLFEIDKNGIETERTWDELADIIGLDYEQFLRTVLLAQGSFANFLNAKEDERYELLEKLIGCGDTYKQIVDEIRAQKTQAAQDLKVIQAQIGEVKQFLLDDEQLHAATIRQEELQRQEEELNLRKKQNEEQLSWFEKEGELAKELAQYEAALTDASQKVKEYAPTRDRFYLHQVLIPAIDIYKEETSAQKEAKQIELDKEKKQAEQERLTAQIKQADDAKIQLEAALEHAKRTREEKTPAINRAREHQTLLTREKSTLTAKEAEKKKAQTDLHNAETQLKQNSEQITLTNREKVEAERNQTALLQQLEEEKAAINNTLETLTLQVKTEEDKIAGQDIEALQSELNALGKLDSTAKQTLDFLKELADCETLKIKLDKQITEKTEEQNSAKVEESNLKVADLYKSYIDLRDFVTQLKAQNISDLRHSLKPGDECPLCGSTHHPFCDAFTIVEQGFDDKLRLLEAEYSTAKHKSDELNAKISKLEGEIGELKKQKEENAKKISSLHDKITILQKENPEFDSELSIENIRQNCAVKTAEINLAIKNYSEVDKSLKSLRKKLDTQNQKAKQFDDRAKTEAEKAEKAVREADTKLKTLIAQEPQFQSTLKEKEDALSKVVNEHNECLESIEFQQNKIKELIGNTTPDALANELRKAEEDATAALENKKQEVNTLINTLGTIKGAMENMQHQLQEKHEIALQAHEKLEIVLHEYNLKANRLADVTRQMVVELSEATDDWTEISNELNRRFNAETAAKTLFENTQKEVAKHLESKPEKSREELLDEAETLKLQSHTEEIAEIMSRIRRHEDAKSTIGQRAEELTRREQLNTNWEQISAAIGGADGKALRKLAQCYTLRFLIAHANSEIRKFNSRYELKQVKNSLGIRVIDHDRADDVREVTSLSGGETFIVSLGMALGLAALSSRNISFDNLFIDEGFGTLDPSSLSMVIDALAALQSSQNKKVGVISHTDTMSERITTQIRVIKNGNSGSSHIEIYP